MTRVRLVHWRIVRLVAGADRSDHFNGLVEGTTRGRVSSRVVRFDHATMTGETQSGNLYQLVGPPGRDAAADTVLAIWLAQADDYRLTLSVIDVDDIDPLGLDLWIGEVEGARTHLIVSRDGVRVSSPPTSPREQAETLAIALPEDADPDRIEADARRTGSDLNALTLLWQAAAGDRPRRRRIEDHIRRLLRKAASQ